MKRLLYLSASPIPPSTDSSLSKFNALSSFLEGDILECVWWKSKKDYEKYYNTPYGSPFMTGNFESHFLFLEAYPSWLRFTAKVFYYIRMGLKLHKNKGKYDIIMSYGSNSTGISACVLKLLTGSKTIIEIPGVPEDGSLLDNPKPIFLDKLRLVAYNLILKAVLRITDHVKLLYDDQLRKYDPNKNLKTSVFHDFVPTDIIASQETSAGRYFLFLGYPWYRKGVDILIEAFNIASKSNPYITLKIAGWIPDLHNLQKHINANPKIEILGPIQTQEAHKLIANCLALVLPSRSEAMGRVLLEAMAAKKPIIGSSVNGIPTYIKHRVNGLLFESENIAELSAHIIELSHNPDLAIKLGQNGHCLLSKEFDEKAYVRKSMEMIDKVLAS